MTMIRLKIQTFLVQKNYDQYVQRHFSFYIDYKLLRPYKQKIHE